MICMPLFLQSWRTLGDLCIEQLSRIIGLSLGSESRKLQNLSEFTPPDKTWKATTPFLSTANRRDTLWRLVGLVFFTLFPFGPRVIIDVKARFVD
jgi:hypothetical protein